MMGLLFFLVEPTVGSAAPVSPVCAPGTLQQYIDLGVNGCQLGDKFFFNFGYVPFPAFIPNPTPNQILVTPISTALNPGFTFTSNPAWTAVGPDIAFTVLIQPQGNPIADASLALGVDQVAPNGSVGINERLCLNGTWDRPSFITCSTNNSTTLIVADAAPPVVPVRQAATNIKPPVPMMDVDLRLSVSKNLSLTSFTAQFSEIPEPGTSLLTFPALLVFAGVAVFKQRRKNCPGRS